LIPERSCLRWPFHCPCSGFESAQFQNCVFSLPYQPRHSRDSCLYLPVVFIFSFETHFLSQSGYLCSSLRRSSDWKTGCPSFSPLPFAVVWVFLLPQFLGPQRSPVRPLLSYANLQRYRLSVLPFTNTELRFPPLYYVLVAFPTTTTFSMANGYLFPPPRNRSL